VGSGDSPLLAPDLSWRGPRVSGEAAGPLGTGERADSLFSSLWGGAGWQWAGRRCKMMSRGVPGRGVFGESWMGLGWSGGTWEWVTWGACGLGQAGDQGTVSLGMDGSVGCEECEGQWGGGGSG